MPTGLNDFPITYTHPRNDTPVVMNAANLKMFDRVEEQRSSDQE